MVKARSAGFTLIEVLIAMGVTVLIAGVSFLALSTVINGVEVLREASARTHELNRLWQLLSRDLREFTPRPVRDEFGQLEAAMLGGELADNSLVFTRLGWHNGNQRPRSNLQRVRYRLEDEVLWRENYRVLDRADDSEPQRVEILEGVLRFELAFMAADSQIDGDELSTEDWPENWGIGAGTGSGAQPPQAIEVTLEVEGLGEIRRLYEVPPS
jgi:general secretion pathway protein J